MTNPIAIDLYCGLGGWASGCLAEGYYVVGFDNERHQYGDAKYPAQLVLQDVLTLHGSQFKDAALIVASPPCQEYSYMAMPWSKAKAIEAEYKSGARDVADLTRLFDACFRIQREAIEAAGRHIPLIVENVRGAQKWVGRSRWNFGSFHLWGDVPALMPMAKTFKVPGFRFDGSGKSFQTASVAEHGIKAPGMNWSDPTLRGQDFTRLAGAAALKTIGHPNIRDGHAHTKHLTNPGEHGTKNGGDWFNAAEPSEQRRHGSKSSARKAASAMIAKIPLPLSRYIAATFKPR